MLGAASGFALLFSLAANVTPTFVGDHRLTIVRALAAGLAVFVSAVLQDLLKATSATAPIVAPGTETATITGAARLICGIILVTTLGEAARHLILRMKDP